MPPLFTTFSLASSSWYSGQDWVATPCHSAMADSSIVTLGPGRSLLVDSSVYDSRMAETTKEQFFMGLHADETEGKWTALFLGQPYINWHFCRVDRFTAHKHNNRGYFLPVYLVYFHRDSPLPMVFFLFQMYCPELRPGWCWWGRPATSQNLRKPFRYCRREWSYSYRLISLWTYTEAKWDSLMRCNNLEWSDLF